MNTQQEQQSNILEDLFSSILSMAIVYGVPLLLLGFGAYYIFTVLENNSMDVAVRVIAAALLPMSLTLAFAKSNARENTIVFLSNNRLVSFASAFVIAMVTLGIAQYASELRDVPVGVLTFSATLALMVFGNDKRNKVSFLHIGAVTGFLSYIIVFGVPG